MTNVRDCNDAERYVAVAMKRAHYSAPLGCNRYDISFFLCDSQRETRSEKLVVAARSRGNVKHDFKRYVSIFRFASSYILFAF